MHPFPLLVAAFLTAAFLVAPSSPALAQAKETDSQAAAAAVSDYHAALEAGNTQAISRLLAPDAVILESGALETRKQYLEHHLQADIGFAQAVRTRRADVQVAVLGDAAWVSSTSEAQGTYKNRAVHIIGAELMVLSKTPAGWVIRAIHWSSRKPA